MGGKAIIRTGLALAACLALSACSAEPAPERKTVLPTFVSLNPCLDAILVEVAAPDQVLALSHYSRDPAASSMDVEVARGFGVTGGTAEEIIALEPDIVLASTFIDPATRAALEQAGLVVETFEGVDSVDTSKRQIERLADLAGHPGGALDLLYDLDAQHLPPVEPFWRNGTINLREPVPNPSVILWQEGEIVAGEASLIVELMKESGLTNHAETLGLGQADRVSLEQVLASPPDLLLVAGTSTGQLHPALKAMEQTRVHSFDPRLFYCGGRSIVEARQTLRGLRESFAPEPLLP